MKNLYNLFTEKPTKELFISCVVYTKLGKKTCPTTNKNWGRVENEVRRELEGDEFSDLVFAKPFDYKPKKKKSWPDDIDSTLLSLRDFLISQDFKTSDLNLMFSEEISSRYRKTILHHVLEASKKTKNGKDATGTDLSYNRDHKEEKDKFTRRILKTYKFNSIIDLFAGPLSFYRDPERNLGCVSAPFIDTNDKEEGYVQNNLHMKVEDLVPELFREGRTYDLVDVDPFGSPATHRPLVDYILLSRKVLIMTFCGAARGKSIEHIDQNYDWKASGIDPTKGNFMDNIINHMPILGKTVGKRVSCIGLCTYKGNNSFRVAFSVEDL